MSSACAYLEVVGDIVVLMARRITARGCLIRWRGLRVGLVFKGVPLRSWFVSGVGSHFAAVSRLKILPVSTKMAENDETSDGRGWEGDR
jgi:hypothetical protein